MIRTNVLMVEDSASDADQITARLKAGGIDAEVRRVATREAFAAALATCLPDLILCDFAPPDFDGRTALSLARQYAPDTPFIFLSAVPGEEHAIDMLHQGATDYVLKQRLGRLAPAVTRALAESADRRARRHAEEGLRIAAESAHLGSWHRDLLSGAVEMTETAKANYGLPPEARPVYDDIVSAIHPDDRDGVAAALRDAIARRVPYQAEYRVVWPDGSLHWLSASGRVITSPVGEPLRLVGISLDVTARKLAELESKRAMEAAEEASRAKDQFLAILSHELRTPLSPILTTIQILEMESNLADDQREGLQVIRRNAELEARLIDDLLDLTRITRGKLQLHVQPVNVHTLLESAIEICSGDVLGKRHDLQVELRATNPFMNADSARLQQVLWNLLKNATKFTPLGGRITVRTANDVTGALVVEVSDSGIGIAADALPRIFHAFEQANSTVTRQFGGLGLGLAIARALAEMHGGRLHAHSSGPGQGATFTLCLPTLDSPRRQPAAPVRHSASENRRLKILLVEDHPDTAKALARLLRIRGHDVTLATTVQSALDAAAGDRFDLLVSDIGLPDGSGIDVVRHFDPTHRIPAIALTGYGTDQDIMRCRQAGFHEHLTKPVNFDKLESTIRSLARDRLGSDAAAPR